jgi:hypothetical protein
MTNDHGFPAWAGADATPRFTWPHVVGLQPAGGFPDRETPFLQPLLHVLPKPWMVLEQTIDQIVIFLDGDELKRGHAPDGDDHWFPVTEPGISVEPGLCFGEWNHFHGLSVLLGVNDQRVPWERFTSDLHTRRLRGGEYHDGP